MFSIEGDLLCDFRTSAARYGIHWQFGFNSKWIPAFAGMTLDAVLRSFCVRTPHRLDVNDTTDFLVRGVLIRARVPLNMAIWTYCNGLVPVDVRGMDGRARVPLKMAIW